MNHCILQWLSSLPGEVLPIFKRKFKWWLFCKAYPITSSTRTEVVPFSISPRSYVYPKLFHCSHFSWPWTSTYLQSVWQLWDYMQWWNLKIHYLDVQLPNFLSLAHVFFPWAYFLYPTRLLLISNSLPSISTWMTPTSFLKPIHLQIRKPHS
jgi:hypothetical protein